jgi:hypothetical protein
MEICSRLGCRDGTLYRALQEAKIPLRGIKASRPASRRKWITQEYEEIIDQWKEGSSKSKIAKEHKTHPGTIDCILRAHGYDPSDLRYAQGKKNHRWKNGRTFDKEGYILIRVTDEIKFWLPPNWKNPYAREHRIIMAEHLNRPLVDDETVHHKNGNRADNRIENLQLRRKAHGEGQVFVCQKCGSNDISAESII